MDESMDLPQWLTLKIAILEMPAVMETTTVYITYLEKNVLATEERAIVITALRQLLSRLQQLTVGRDGFHTAYLTFEEMMVFGQAVIVYHEIVRTRPSLLPRGGKGSNETLMLVKTMQKRFLDGQGRQQA